jgi:hypothetical protein
MGKVRQPNFKFDEAGPEFDWDNMPEDKVADAVDELNKFLDEQVEPEIYRLKELIPNYANVFLKNYLLEDSKESIHFSSPDVLSIFNYLEYGFEVELDNLKVLESSAGIAEFSTNNYPFGGLERFIMTLMAFGLKPIACFDGFNECEINWTSQFNYESTALLKQNRFQRLRDRIKNRFLK